MVTEVRARYSNGTLTLLDPVDLEEGTEVVLTLEGTLAAGRPTVRVQLTVIPGSVGEAPKSQFQVVPFHSEFVPGMDDPKRMKQLLEDEDIEHFIRVQKYGKGTWSYPTSIC